MINAAAKKIVRGTRGQSLVEFALILPIFLVVMFMITEFGRALFQYNVLVTATRAGARAGVIAGSGAAVARATQMADSVLINANIPLNSVNVQAVVDLDYAGNGIHVLTVTADKNFDWLYKGGIKMQGNATVAKPGALNLHAQTVMQGEGF